MAVVQNAYTYRMPSGFAGAVNREWAHIGEPNQLDATSPPTAYGDPVKMGSNGRIQALAPGDTTAAIYGFLERPFPGQPGASYGAATQLLGSVTPPAGGRCTIMKAGYISVVLQGATPAAKGGTVYVRLAGTLPSGGRVSGFEAAVDATPANTPVVPNAYFMGAADANGNTEIAFNL